MFVNRLVVDIILHLNVLENKLPSKSKLVQSKCGCEFTDKWHPQHWATMNSADSPVSPLYTLPSYTWVYTSSKHGQNYACDTLTHPLKPHALSSHTYISTGNQRFQQFTLNKNRKNILPLVYHPCSCFTRFMAMLILVDYQFWWISRLSKNMTPFFMSNNSCFWQITQKLMPINIDKSIVSLRLI